METPTLDYSKNTTQEQKKPSLFSRILSIFKKKQKKVPLTDEEMARIEYEEYIKLKAEIKDYPRMIQLGIVGTILGVIAWLIVIWSGYSYLQGYVDFTFFIFSALLVLGTAKLVSIDNKRLFRLRDMRRRISEYELSHAKEQAQEDPFQNAIKTSYTYLDRYYDQTQQQAKSGFRITMCVALFGAGLISVGVWLLFFGDNEKITPAYITCASGVITEFISSIFFAMYNKTVTSMNSYHDKLVLSQNIAFALRVAGEMEDKDEKNKANLAIINELVKDVNAQMMKSDADTDEPKKKSGDGKTSPEKEP